MFAPGAPRGWNTTVAVCAAVVLLVALATGIGWLASSQSHVSTYAYASAVRQVNLKLSSGDVVIVGSGSPTVEVRRSDHYAFGHPAREHRSLSGGTLTVTSACPRIVVGSCSSSYEVAVPETVTVNVVTTSGSVRLDGFRGNGTIQTDSGSVDAEAYCGFDLSAVSGSGDLRIATACSPQRLQLRTGSGNAVALVPPGRYRIEASGHPLRVSGVTRDPNAPFSLGVHSGGGAATIGGGL